MSMDFTFNFSAAGGSESRVPRDDDPFRILVMADFSGRDTNASNAKLLHVDIDSIDDHMRRLAPSASITIEDHTFVLNFEDLESFHPDAVFERASIFDDLKALRSRLQNPATFEAAADEVRSWGQSGSASRSASAPESNASPAPQPTQDDAHEESVESTLERLLGKASGSSSSSASSSSTPSTRPTTTRSTTVDISGMIRELVAPHVVPEAHPSTDELVAVVDDAMSVWMRAILHHPDFRALENAWRAVHFLITNLETDETLQVHMLDVGQDALQRDLDVDDIVNSALFKVIAEGQSGQAGAQPISVIVGHYTFGKNLHDIATLLRMSAVATAAGAPFLAAADPSFVGLESFDQPPDCNDWDLDARCDTDVSQAWNAVRMSPGSRSIALTMPRIAARLPYGPKTDPVSAFAFEELPPATLADPHEAFPWTSAATACACLLGQAFADHGWRIPAAISGDVGGLPVFITVDRHGDRTMQPIAEAWLPDRAGQRIADAGFVPILSIQNRDAIRVVSLQSIAKTDSRVRAKWVH